MRRRRPSWFGWLNLDAGRPGASLVGRNTLCLALEAVERWILAGAQR